MLDISWLNVHNNMYNMNMTVSVIVCGALLTAAYTWTRRRKIPHLPTQYAKIMQLLDSERVISTMDSFNVSTLTFYQGDVDQAAQQLSTRVAEIIAANPWLGGRFSDVTGKVQVHYDDQIHPECFVMNQRITIESPSSDALIDAYFDYAKHPSFMAGTVGAGGKLLNNFGPSGAFFRVTITPINTDTFAVCTSMQHALGDGRTFYAINHMLSSDGCVTALDTTRYENYPEETARVLGKEEAELPLYPSLIIGYLLNALGRKSTRKILSVEVAVNGPAMEKKKQAAAAAAVDTFVSTNDVLTSAFFKAAKTSINFMALDMRSRINLNGHDLSNNTGNIAHFMMYRPSDVATPSLIRKSLRTMKRAATPATPMPGFWDMITGNISVISNWATFYKDVKIKNCQQIVHIPLPETNMVPFVEMGIIFRPASERMAIINNGSATMISNLEKELGTDLLITK